MAAETLTRVDPERNMVRFYGIDVQPTLFGGGTVRTTPYGTLLAAIAAYEQHLQAKRVARLQAF
jgi:hypothetical protein